MRGRDYLRSMPRVIAFAGMAVVLATPFVHNLNQLPWPLVDLFGAIAGLTTVVVVLATRNLFGEHRQLLRHCVGWGLVLLGPVYFVSVARPGAAMDLQRHARAARQQIDLVRFQTWALAITEDRSLIGSYHEPLPECVPVGWDRVPADVRAYLGGAGAADFFPGHTGDDPPHVLVRSSTFPVPPFTNSAMPPPLPMALVVGTSSFEAETNAFWFCELAPGVYLHRYTR